MQVIYRKLKAEEAQAFWDMMNALDNETKFMMYEPGERKKKGVNTKRLKDTIESALIGEDFLLAADVEHQIVGYISAQKGKLERDKHVAYIVIGIREKFRGKGIGTAFFEQLEVWAQEKHVTRLELTVMCANTVAKHLYEMYGFVVEGVKKNSMRIDGEYMDEFSMAKIL